MIYRPTEPRVVIWKGTEVVLDPARAYDDQDPETRELIDRYRPFFDSDNIEAATAAPGERRSTRRPKAAA